MRFTQQADGTFSGGIEGTSAVTFDTGAAVSTFSGTNTYTGATTVNAGTLAVTGGAALADTNTSRSAWAEPLAC